MKRLTHGVDTCINICKQSPPLWRAGSRSEGGY